MFGVGNIGRIGRADYSAARGGLPPPILDQLGITAAAAYSLRQVRLAALLACRVRRSSDNAELNIGFATAVQTRTNLAAIPINNDSGQSVGGVAITTIGTGTEFGQPYVDVRWQGTAVGGAFLTLGHGARGVFNPALQAPVTPGLNYTASVGYRLLAGTFPTTPFVQVDALFFSASGAFIVAASSTVPAATAVLQRCAASGVAPEGAAYCQPIWRVFATNGTVVDFTMRFYTANVEQGIGNARPLLQRNVPEVVADIGDLDAEALLTFVGNGNGFVTTWYDQSGNGRNATQTDPTLQPRIVSNGALITENGRPAVSVSTDYMASQSFSGLTSYTLNTVYNASATGDYSMAVVLNPGQVEFRRSQNLSYMEYIVNSSTAITLNTASLGAQAIMTATVTNADQKAYVNGLLEGSQTSSPTAAILVSIGNRSDGAAYPYTGTMQEITLFNSVLSNTDRQTLDRSQGAYYGIAVA
jgi:hypothetical protein